MLFKKRPMLEETYDIKLSKFIYFKAGQLKKGVDIFNWIIFVREWYI
jgi:hypothetical protein